MGLHIPEAQSAAQNRRLRSVDVLRGLAALGVLFSHVPHLEYGSSGNRLCFLPLDFGARGVVLFFVISGFCIHLGVAQKLARGQGVSCNWTAFWRRRFYRLYPPYLAAICLGLLLLLPLGCTSGIIHNYLTDTSGLAWDLGAHLLMVHNLFKRYIFGLGNPVYWTLGVEEQLYALYALYLVLRYWLPAGRAFRITVAVTLLWYGLGIAGTLLRTGPAAGWPPLSWVTWPFSSWFIWTLGALAAEAYTGAITLPRWCYNGWVALVWGVLGVLLYPAILNLLHVQPLLIPQLGSEHWVMRLVNDPWILIKLGDFAFALCFFILMNRWIRAEVKGQLQGRAVAWFAGVGLFSYSLYLTHYPVIRMVDTALEGALGTTILATLIRIGLYVPLCLAVAYSFFKLIESRFLIASRPQKASSAAKTTSLESKLVTWRGEEGGNVLPVPTAFPQEASRISAGRPAA
jgi:peptidoglycan/LPS O-acetylase OafA/YrhL